MMRMVALLVALLVSAPAFAGQGPNVTGKWNVSFYTGQGTLPATMDISSEGGKLSAYISSAQGELSAAVTLKDTAITIEGVAQTPNGAINMLMVGKVNADAMTGTVDFGGNGADWEATRATPVQPNQGGQGGGSQEKPAASMTGTWAFEVTHSAGVSTPTVTITQTGEKLSGKYVSTYGQFELTGSTKGADFTFSVEVGTEQKVTLVYTGTLNGDAVKGSVTMGEMGEGTFTCKRK